MTMPVRRTAMSHVAMLAARMVAIVRRAAMRGAVMRRRAAVLHPFDHAAKLLHDPIEPVERVAAARSLGRWSIVVGSDHPQPIRRHQQAHTTAGHGQPLPEAIHRTSPREQKQKGFGARRRAASMLCPPS